MIVLMLRALVIFGGVRCDADVAVNFSWDLRCTYSSRPKKADNSIAIRAIAASFFSPQTCHVVLLAALWTAPVARDREAEAPAKAKDH